MGIQAADIRSHLHEKIAEGVHPVAMASSVVDALDRSSRRGLEGLEGKLHPLDPSAAAELEDPTDGPAAALERAETGEEVRQVRAKLTPRQQEILELYGKGMRFAEIARALGVSRAAVTQAVRRAQASLRKRLSS